MRRALAWDTETCLIRPGLLAPPMVCVTWQVDGESAHIAHHTESEALLRAWLEDDSLLLVGHNVAYDMAVVCERFPALRPLVWAAYAADRVTDTQIRQQLIDIANGEFRVSDYSLETLARRCAGMVITKDAWRLSYAEFIGTPVSDWSTRALEVQADAKRRIEQIDSSVDPSSSAKERAHLMSLAASDPHRVTEYPLDDARATLAVFKAQESSAWALADQYRQARGAWALHLSSAWGLMVSPDGVEALRAGTQAAYDELEADLIAAGLLRADATRDTKAAQARMLAVCEEQGMAVPRTKKEGVKLDAEACEATCDPMLLAYSELGTLKKVLSNDVEMLTRGTRFPIQTRYGMAATGRTTSSKPAIQNLCKREGIRESFVARPGCVFVSCDYPSLESYTWAQCCFTWLGESRLAEALNGGLDPHLHVAASILGVTYEVAKARYDAGEQEVADVRQLAKVANFGFPGGMGAATMLLSVKKQLKPAVVARLDIGLDRVRRLRDEWLGAWPEAPLYFERVQRLTSKPKSGKPAPLETLFTQRLRGGASYCAAANNGFQALGADIGKEALWLLSEQQYVREESPLFNTRTVAFVHDEIIIEAPESRTHEAGNTLADVMTEAAAMYLPDVRIPRAKVKPSAMRRWSKRAVAKFDDAGRLTAWDL